MSATIKAIAPSTIHQIQSGQVIVDLCSVVKELVENSLDAHATTIEVRFREHGLESIEVQDNGTGIAEANYESLALKHYTSKLSSYDDLDDLLTFGFRGEALSSLCALSTLTIVTAEAHETPKGRKLEFETSGNLKSATFIAAQKGTIVSVENLFYKLPVRQKELSKNIKREYSKVLKLLQAYACISTKVKFVVKHASSKGKQAVVFSTNGNASTRDNVANVFGSKLLSQLIDLNLKLDYNQSLTQRTKDTSKSIEIAVIGHMSRPVFGEGKQSTDQQMFFVNGRPCNLPQIAKAINETYRSYNVSQSPFVFANLKLDTSSYDVNVSPDKRTILLHDAAALTERLKEELVSLFDKTEQTVPQSQVPGKKLPAFRQLTVSRTSTLEENDQDVLDSALPDRRAVPPAADDGVSDDSEAESEVGSAPNLLRAHFRQHASTREDEPLKKMPDPEKVKKAREKYTEKMAEKIKKAEGQARAYDEYDDVQELLDVEPEPVQEDIQVRDFNARMAEAQQRDKLVVDSQEKQLNEPESSENDKGVVNRAYDRMRPPRRSPEIAIITIGDKVVTRLLDEKKPTLFQQSRPRIPQFSQHLTGFDMNEKGRDVELDDNAHECDEHEAEPDEEQHEQQRQFTTQAHLSLDTMANGIMDEVTRQSYDHEPTTPFNVRLIDNKLISTQQTNIKNSRAAQDEEAARNQEEFRVSELIRMAEITGKASDREKQNRTNQALKGSIHDSTASIVAILDTDLEELSEQCETASNLARNCRPAPQLETSKTPAKVKDETERLSLTISKSDFSKMHIAGQFNLGFIIALRHKDLTDAARQQDELFIIDQHASDEKYNFERLQAETTVGSQRLVHPIKLELTAVDEEIVFDHDEALRQNGFIIEADTSGKVPVGERCQLMSLPLSKELTFNTHDLEELIHLLSDVHVSTSAGHVPRPGKVRKMFAMRACRSSIMIGKTLSMRQMHNILHHMGTIDKPWNCPHGRPTMRHLTSLDQLDNELWTEGDGLVSDPDYEEDLEIAGPNIWQQYMA